MENRDPGARALWAEQLAYAMGPPVVSGRLREAPEDFVVEEDLGFLPDGQGDHALLLLAKRNANTEWVARRLAELAGVRPFEVGYAGLKDRRSVARQWFSVPLAGRPEPDWQRLESEDVRVLSVTRHRRKLRRGALKGNRFALTVRAIQGDLADLHRRLESIADRGVPNYFGEQRFGHGAANLSHAQAMLTGALQVRDRHKRGIYLSAARSWLFNRVLSCRVEQGSWDQALAGDTMMLAGTHSLFTVAEVDDPIRRRILDMNIHPTGPLWGRGEPPTRLESRQLEEQALAGLELWCQGLERAGLTQERRSLRLRIDGLEWEIDAHGDLYLRFRLPAGGYATSVLRELIEHRS
jgi:tRNA pseudouridine13 synthase